MATSTPFGHHETRAVRIRAATVSVSVDSINAVIACEECGKVVPPRRVRVKTSNSLEAFAFQQIEQHAVFDSGPR